MPTLKEAFAEIKKLIALKFDAAPSASPAPAATPAEAVPVDYPLADGRVLSIDTLATGGVVTIAGAPAPDATYTLADGTAITTAGGIITGCLSSTQEVDEDMSTPAKMQAALQKFADGAATPDLQKITTIMKAVFEYCFGYEIRRAQEVAQRDAAIAVYQTGFAAVKADAEIMKQENANFKSVVEKTLALVEQIGEGMVDTTLEQHDPEKLTAFQKHELKKAGKA